MYFEGFDRIAFFNDYAFVCFGVVEHAISAIDEITKNSKMRASFAKVDFIHHSVVPSQIGAPNVILRISDFPGNMSQSELIGIFSILEGYSHVSHFYVASCLVHFKSLEFSKNALEWFNHSTNLTAVYSTKGTTVPQDFKKMSKSKTSDLPALIPVSFHEQTRFNNTKNENDECEKEEPNSTLKNQQSDASINSTVIDCSPQPTLSVPLHVLHHQYQDAKTFLDSMFSRLAFLEKENETLKKVFQDQKSHEDGIAWDISALVQENQILKRENEKLLKSLESHENDMTESSHNLGMLQGLLAMCD